MKFYVIAGEASGDLHGSKLIREISKLMPGSEFRCWGGDRMEREGGVIVKHYKDLAFMGFLEVLLNLRTILRNIRFCKEDIDQWKPDAVILVDYPGFNLRIAKYVHDKGIKVIYYISPQVWAWRQSRVHNIHKITDLAFVVLPFEKDFHTKFGYHAEFTGHPLLDTIGDFTPDPNFMAEFNLGEKPVITLVPGSRKQEIHRILPTMLSIIPDFPQYQFVIAGVNSLGSKYYKQFTEKNDTRVIIGQTYNLLSYSDAALVTSGTATLETALLGTPQVVCYKMSFITALLAWMLIKVEFISLVNLVLGRKAVTELIQYKYNHHSVEKELRLILEDKKYRDRMIRDYAEMKIKLGEQGASAKAAKLIVETVNK